MTAEAILYPHTYGGWPPCRGCFRQTDTAHAIDPRTDTLTLLCGPCYRALAAGQAPPLPTGKELAATWQTLARLHQNEEIDDDVAASALATLAPRLSREDGWAAFARLQHELLQLQDAEDRCAVLDVAAIGPDHTPETYVNHLHGCVDDAVRALIGGAA